MPKTKKATEHSRTEHALRGKTLPGFPAPIKEILKSGTKRKIVFADGRVHITTKRKLTEAYAATTSLLQAQRMKKTIQPTRNGKVSMQIGGHLKGVEKTYKDRKAAIKALERRYGVDPTKQVITRRPVASKIGSIQRQQDRERIERNGK